MLLLLYS